MAGYTLLLKEEPHPVELTSAAPQSYQLRFLQSVTKSPRQIVIGSHGLIVALRASQV